jgi:hypothetical protein
MNTQNNSSTSFCASMENNRGPAGSQSFEGDSRGTAIILALNNHTAR